MMDVNDATDRLSLIVEVEGSSSLKAKLDHGGGAGDSAAYSIIWTRAARPSPTRPLRRRRRRQ
jgi:hypothetical protein